MRTGKLVVLILRATGIMVLGAACLFVLLIIGGTVKESIVPDLSSYNRTLLPTSVGSTAQRA